jgi:DNA-binding NtrC family response regulator
MLILIVGGAEIERKSVVEACGKGREVVELENAEDALDEVARRVLGSPQAATRTLDERVEELEARLITEAMREAGDNQVRAAELLGTTRSTLQYKLKKYGYKPERKAA